MKLLLSMMIMMLTRYTSRLMILKSTSFDRITRSQTVNIKETQESITSIEACSRSSIRTETNTVLG